MQQENLRQLQQWYGQSEDAVLFYASDGTRIWNNAAAEPWTTARDCPLPRRDNNGEIRYGTFAVSHSGELYRIQQALRTWNGAELVLVQICTQPAEKFLWENEEKQREIENHIAHTQQKIFGISNAVTALYASLAELDDTMLDVDPDELMEQLNVIQGNCCRLEQPFLLWLETAKYYQKNETAEKIVLLDRAVSSFMDSCQQILGRTVRMYLEREAIVCVPINPQRLRTCLLCIVRRLLQYRSNANRIILTLRQEDDMATLYCTATVDGSRRLYHRHSAMEPLHKSTQMSAEEKIIHLFCETYHVTPLQMLTEYQAQFSLRIPLAEKDRFPSVEDTRSEIKDEMFSLYHVFLSDISDYRFY